MSTPETITDTDRSRMARAIELARHAATLGEVPIGAVVYDTQTGEILGEGSNTRETQRDPCGHAELIAVRRLGHDLKDGWAERDRQPARAEGVRDLPLADA